MGIFKKIFGKKEEIKNINKDNIEQKSKDTDLVINNKISKSSLLYLKIHEDIKDLIWVGDGENKNLYIQEKKEVYRKENFIIEIMMSMDEPSTLYLEEAIEECDDYFLIERPGYFPSYRSLSPSQKYVYWKYLENPYDNRFDIGYVFILYYGLERYLLDDNKCEEAFNVILKLRDVFDNKSFQLYSANALILTCLYKQKPNLLVKFLSSIDREYEYNYNHNLYLLCKLGLNIPLIAKDIMRMAKHIEFNNTNYIKNYLEIFENQLNKSLIEKYPKGLMVNNFVSSVDFNKLHIAELKIYCNMSLDNKIKVPLVIEHFKLKKALYELLEQTHNEVKDILNEKRKNNENVEKCEKEKKPLIIQTFDEKEEETLLHNYSTLKNVMDKHLSLIVIQDFYYKYRTIDDKYINECIYYCNEHLKIANGLKKYSLNENKKNFERIKEIIMNDIQQLEFLERKSMDFPRVPAFERLDTIYKNRKEYYLAIEVCNKAIKYYEGSENKSEIVEKFRKKKLDYENKLMK